MPRLSSFQGVDIYIYCNERIKESLEPLPDYRLRLKLTSRHHH